MTTPQSSARKLPFARGSWALTCFALVAACGGDNSPSPVAAPGEELSARTQALDAGAAILQDRSPLAAVNSYLDGFHFYSGNPAGQMEAHHYCSQLSEDVTQCVIYDGNARDAKMMGIEYIVSAEVFASLEPAEKALWHSHVHEVRSGQLIAPGIPQLAEHELMEKLVSTYGKTWHTWHTDQGKELPLGTPMLMMGFTADGQLEPKRLEERDRRFDVSSEEKRRERADIPAPAIDPAADSWQKGPALQLSLTSLPADSAARPGAHH